MPELESPSSPPRRLLRLRCAVQHDDWGRRGAASLVARLSGDPNPNPDLPFAGLWMGTHLGDWLAQNPRRSARLSARWGGDLPFLLKVLSPAKPLSMQSHPDKKLVKMLHTMPPGAYKNGNHC